MTHQTFTDYLSVATNRAQQITLNRKSISSIEAVGNLLNIDLCGKFTNADKQRHVWEIINHKNKTISLWSMNNIVGISLGNDRELNIPKAFAAEVIFATLRVLSDDKLQIYVADSRNDIYQFLIDIKTSCMESLHFSDHMQDLPSTTLPNETIQYIQLCPVFNENIFFLWIIFQTKIILIGHNNERLFPTLLIYDIPSTCHKLADIEVTPPLFHLFYPSNHHIIIFDRHWILRLHQVI